MYVCSIKFEMSSFSEQFEKPSGIGSFDPTVGAKAKNNKQLYPSSCGRGWKSFWQTLRVVQMESKLFTCMWRLD